MRYTAVGAATAIIGIGALRLLVDPAFDPPGGRYRAVPLPGFGCTKVTGPAIAADAIGRIDAALLSHDQHFDNLDPAGRALLPTIPIVLTTPQGARRLGVNARGLKTWETATLTASDGQEIRVTATPARHGPPGATLTAGPVTGFCLAWDGQVHGQLYLSGDTVLYEGVRQVAKRRPISVAVLNLGGARFKGSGPMRYTMNAAQGVLAAKLLNARTVIPNHFAGFTHLREGIAEARPVFDAAGVPARWILPGQTEDVEV